MTREALSPTRAHDGGAIGIDGLVIITGGRRSGFPMWITWETTACTLARREGGVLTFLKKIVGRMEAVEAGICSVREVENASHGWASKGERQFKTPGTYHRRNGAPRRLR